MLGRDHIAALARLPGLTGLRDDEIAALPVKGLVHRHWRLRGMLLRVPYRGDMTDLARQAAAFARMVRVPRLIATLAPSPAFAHGALLVEEIAGNVPRLDREMGAIAATLAAIHALPVPTDPAPLAMPADPIRAILDVIKANRPALDAIGAHRDACRQIDDEIAWAERFDARGLPRLTALNLVDCHPGNFLMRDGVAVFLDVERAIYANPAIDVAHASVPPATCWDPAGRVLTRAEVERFVAEYIRLAGDRVTPWLTPFRRLLFTRTTTVFARLIRDGGLAGLEPATRAHSERVIARALDPDMIAQGRAEWLGPNRLGFCS